MPVGPAPVFGQISTDMGAHRLSKKPGPMMRRALEIPVGDRAELASADSPFLGAGERQRLVILVGDVP